MNASGSTEAGGHAAQGPLAGICVLDLSRALAGPWCAQNLADLGADVIKIERPGTGDESRQWGPPWLPDGQGRPTRESAYYLSSNRNKRSVAIDIAKPEGQLIVRGLAARADIFLENFKLGDLARYGLDWPRLREDFPSLIYCSITGFGQDGPFADRPGYDYLFQGLGGLMSVTGERSDKPGGGPQRVGVPVVDLFTGMYATVSILAALQYRNASGRGQHIDISLFDSVMAMGAGMLSNYFVGGRVPRLIGNASPNIAPYEVFDASDGQMIVTCANQTQFESLCRTIGRPDWIADPRFTSNGARLAHHSELHDLLNAIFRSRSQREWERQLFDAGVPCGPINDYAQAAAHPQAAHRGTRVELPHPLGASAPGVASPMRFSESPVEYGRAPPLLGEHTREILSQRLGMSDIELDHLEAEGVIATSDLLRRTRASLQ